MSQPLYNPYASGNQSSTQGQYGLPGIQPERDIRRATCHSTPGTSLSSSGTSSVIPESSAGMLTSLMSQSMNYRPEQTRDMMDEDIERSVDMHISRAREEVRLHGKTMHQHTDQGTHFTGAQRTTYPMTSSSASREHRHSDTESGNSSLEWLSDYKRSTTGDSKFYSSALSNYGSHSDGRFNASSERDRDMQSIPGLGDYDYPVPDKPAASSEPSRPKYTSESAANILLHFGLEKEDLELLISYPEDQITPANLPYILRQIRIQKAKRTTTAVKPKSYPEPQPTRSVSGIASHSSAGGTGMRQEELSSAVLQPSKVIDYGHTGKYTGGIGEDIGRTSGSKAHGGGTGSMLMMKDISRHSRDQLQKSTTEGKSSALGSSREQARATTSLSPFSSVLSSLASQSKNQTKQLQTQPDKTPQTILGSFSRPKKDTDIRVLKPEASKPVPLKAPETDRQATSKTQPPSSLFRGIHPSRPGLVVIGSNNAGGSKDQGKTQGQGSSIVERMKKQQVGQQMQNQAMQQMQQISAVGEQRQIQPVGKQLTQQKQQMQQIQKQPVSQTGQAAWLSGFSTATSVAPAPGASRAMQHPVFIPGDLRSINIPPALQQQIQSPMNFKPLTPLTSNRPPLAKVTASKSLPTLVMMQDYAATSPRIFPHTCSLCNKECTNMKDWITHQNTSLHLENCKCLRTQYPEWDGEITLGTSSNRSAGKDDKPTISTSSEHRYQKRRHGSRSRSKSRSRSSSPRRFHSSEGRRERRSSRSPRYSRRSRSRSCSPRYDYPTSSRYRSHSRSPKRRSPPRRREETRSSPRRSDNRRPSPRRSRENQLSLRRSDERRSPSRRSRESRSSEASPPQRKKPRSAETLAKKILKTSAVQSLSTQSDVEAVVTAVLAELTKKKSTSTTSTSLAMSSSSAKKESTLKTSKAKPGLQKSVACSSTRIEPRKSSAPTMVHLGGIHRSISHDDVKTAMEEFGKIKSLLLIRAVRQATVCFEKEEDAKKVKSLRSLVVKGLSITVVRKKSPGEEEPLIKKPATSGNSAPQTTKPTTTNTDSRAPLSKPKKLPLKGPSSSDTKGKPVKGAKAKVLVSKAKNVSTKQISIKLKAGKLPAKGGVKKAAVKRKPSSESKSTTPQIQPDVSDSKQTLLPETSDTNVEETVVELKETSEAEKPANRTIGEPAKGEDSVTEGEVWTSEAIKATPETPVDSLAAGGTAAEEKVEQSGPASETQTSKSEASETKVQESTVISRDAAEVEDTIDLTDSEPQHQANPEEDEETAKDDETGNRTDSEPSADKEADTEAKVLASEAEKTPTTQEPKTPVEKPAEEEVEQTEAMCLPSKSAASDEETSVNESSETKVHESAVVQRDTAEVEDGKDLTESEPQHEAKPEDVEPMEFEETGAQEPEFTEDLSSAEGNEQKVTTTEAEISADKTCESEPATTTGTAETEPTETSIRASESEPETTTQEPETKAEAPQTQQQTAGSVTAEKTEAASAKDSSITLTAAAAASEQQPASSSPSSTAAARLTVGEMVDKHLDVKNIKCITRKICLSPKFFPLGKKQLLITRLPSLCNEDEVYTEEDVARVLLPFGFQHTDESIYVIPQTGIAFAMMPTVGKLFQLQKVALRKGIYFKGARLFFHVPDRAVTMTPIGFYKSLMKLMKSPVLNDGEKIIFIKNVSQGDVKNLRETLNKIGSVRNFLPLLNKVFVEFESDRDADRLGVFYSFLKQAPAHEVGRLKVPCSTFTSLAPRLPENALPDASIAVAGATVPPIKPSVPQDSVSPFWVPLRASPFLFPTMSPWFIIPDYLTVRGKTDIEKACDHGPMIPTIMLTGLAGGYYKHENVAKLVWQYFPKQDLQSLYYSVLVLTLQRRAFVFFPDWSTCCQFVQDHIKNPLTVKGYKLSVHFVLQHMNFEPSEVVMYTNMMKWSNAGVPDTDSLEDRLLCVEISETSLDIVRVVMEVIASITSFVNVLPLANRILVEMADPSGVTKVLGRYISFPANSSKKRTLWSCVRGFSSMKTLKQRLGDARKITLNSLGDIIFVEGDASAVKCRTQPPSEVSDNESQPEQLTTDPSGSTVSEARVSVSSNNMQTEEDCEETGAKMAAESNFGTETNKDEGSPTTSISAADLTSTSADTTLAAFSSAPSAASLTPEGNFAELPQIDTEIFKALKATVDEHRLNRGIRSQHEENQDLDDFTVSSFGFLNDEQNFNMDDFVTVDEVGDDVEGMSLEPCSSSSSWSSSSFSRVNEELQSSGVKQTSVRSSDDKISASSSSSSSKGSGSSNAASKKSKDSSEPTKSSTKPPSSTSPHSSETSSSSVQKTQQSRMKSSSSKTSFSTSLSPTLHERKQINSAVKAPTVTHSELLKEEKAAVSESDHQVSAEETPTKTVESETEIETSSQMLPPPQGREVELSQAQSLEIDVDVDTLKEQKKSKEEEEEDHDKHSEEDDGENYQVLDSFDDQTAEQMDDGNQDERSETQLTGPEGSHQVLDVVDDEDKTHPEEDSETAMDVSVQVRDSVTEDQAASSQEDSLLLQNEGSASKQQPEDDSTQISVINKDGEKTQNDAELSEQTPSVEVLNPTEDLKNPDGRILNEDLLLQEPNKRDEIKGSETEQETFEILDSIDDQTAPEDEMKNPETPSDHKHEENIRTEEEETYQVIDSLEDQPTTAESKLETDNKDKRTKKGETTARKDGGTSKRSSSTTTTSKSEEEKSPKKQDRTVKKYQTRTKRDSTAGVRKKDTVIRDETVETEYKIVDSVEDEAVQDAATTERSGRRRSARGKKEEKTPVNLKEVLPKHDRVEEATYEILDSVEDEAADQEPTVTTRSTRGKRERTSKKEVLNEKTRKEETPTTKWTSPVKESQEQKREKTPKKEEKHPPTKKSDAVARELCMEETTYEILDSVEEEVVKDDRPATTQKRKRGRPKKEVKTTKRGNAASKKADKDENVAEEEATFQILDSVEDETVDDQPPTDQSESLREENISENDEKQMKNSTSTKTEEEEQEEEEEPMYQIVDSLEDDQEELTATELSDGAKSEERTETELTEKVEKQKVSEASKTGTISEEKLFEEMHDDPSAPEDKKELKSVEMKDTADTSVSLDEVSDEEEDYGDDTLEEEELRRAATKEKEFAKKQETTKTRAKEDKERERRSRSSSRGGRGDRGGTRSAKRRGREDEEQVEVVDTKELVTLDEVGADEPGQKRAPESPEWDGGMAEEDLHTLVTLDEFVEEEEDGKEEPNTKESRPLHEEDQSVDSLNPENLLTLDEAGDDEEEKPDEEPTEKNSRPSKRKHDDDEEESMNFVTVDEVGEDEEKEAVSTRSRGREKKKPRRTPVRKSTRGKKVSQEDQTKDQKEPADEMQEEPPENQTVQEKQAEEEKEGRSKVEVKAVSKQRRELVGPEAKRSRSQSPCVATDFKLPPFKPNNPLGQEFVVPKSGFFCNLCRVFYLNENTAKDVHCSSQRHYDGLQKHYQELQQKQSRRPTQRS